MESQLTQQKLEQQPRPIFRNRPGLSVFLAVILGMACADQFHVPWPIAIYVLVGCVLLGTVSMFLHSSLWQNPTILLCCAALGLSVYSFAVHRYETSPLARYAELPGRSKLQGIVEGIEETRRGNLIIVAVSTVERDSLTLPISGTLAAQLGEPVEDGELALPSAGDTITLFADIFPLRLQRNPYASSYDERLKYHYGADATAELNSRFDYDLRSPAERNFFHRASGYFDGIKQSCDRILAASIPDTEASAFVRAIVLGTRGDLPESTVLDFKYSGLTHLLAISGFNIAVVSLLIAQGLLLIGLRRRIVRLPITAVGVLFYCLVVGLQPSVLRALIMIELYLLAMVLERKSDLTNIAALTALAHMLIDPMVVHDAGFQLSYAAVFGFALIQPHLTRLLEPAKGEDIDHERNIFEWLRHSLILSLSACLATAPVLLFHFRQLSLVALVANLAAIPMAAMITTLGFLLIPLGVIWPAAATVYGEAIGWSVHLLLICSSWLAGLIKGGIVIDLSILVILLLSVTCLWVLHVNRTRDAIRRLVIAGAALIAVGQFVGFSTPRLLPEGEMSIMFADVGQGDAAILKTPGGKCYMFDFGPLQGSDLSFSARPYAPLLQVEGIDKLEAGFITHLHRDHYGAAFSAVYSNELRKIYTVGDRTSDEFAYGLDSLVRSKGIAVSMLHSGQILQLGDGVKIYVLGPDSTLKADQINNDRSLALKIEYGNTSILMLGDLEQAGEKELIARYGLMLKSDIVKVAHHGSISSSIRELVSTSHPDYAVISCGRNNHFGHPHRQVVSRWMRSGADVLRTDREGAIIFASNGQKVRRIEWR